MITKILSGVLLTVILISGVLGWQLKAQIAKTATLKAENAQLMAAARQAVKINAELIKTVKKLQSRNKLTMAQIEISETGKRESQKQIGAKNEQIREQLKREPQWSAAPIPVKAAGPINDLLDRLRKPDSGNRG